MVSLGQVLPHTSTATVVSNPALNRNTSRRCLQRFVHNPKYEAQQVPAAFRQGVLCTLPTHWGVLLVKLQDVPDMLSTDFSHNFADLAREALHALGEHSLVASAAR